MELPQRVNVYGVTKRLQISPNIWCEPLRNQDGKVSGIMIENWNIDDRFPRTFVPNPNMNQYITLADNIIIKMVTNDEGMYSAIIVHELVHKAASLN